MAAEATSGSGKSRSDLMEEETVSHRSEVRREERMRSNASFLETAEAGAAMISVTAVLAMREVSRPAAHCWRDVRRAED